MSYVIVLEMLVHTCTYQKVYCSKDVEFDVYGFAVLPQSTAGLTIHVIKGVNPQLVPKSTQIKIKAIIVIFMKNSTILSEHNFFRIEGFACV